MKNKKNTYLLLCLLSINLFISCNSNNSEIDLISIPTFYESDLTSIYGDSETSWRISEVLTSYNDDEYFLTTECLNDDVYTFRLGIEDVEINLGERMCYENMSESETFEAKLNFNQNNLKVELTLKDCMVQSDGNYEYKTCFITTYYLAELNENRMVFYSGNAEFIGEYEAALVFEKI